MERKYGRCKFMINDLDEEDNLLWACSLIKRIKKDCLNGAIKYFNCESCKKYKEVEE